MIINLSSTGVRGDLEVVIHTGVYAITGWVKYAPNVTSSIIQPSRNSGTLSLEKLKRTNKESAAGKPMVSQQNEL